MFVGLHSLCRLHPGHLAISSRTVHYVLGALRGVVRLTPVQPWFHTWSPFLTPTQSESRLRSNRFGGSQTCSSVPRSYDPFDVALASAELFFSRDVEDGGRSSSVTRCAAASDGPVSSCLVTGTSPALRNEMEVGGWKRGSTKPSQLTQEPRYARGIVWRDININSD